MSDFSKYIGIPYRALSYNPTRGLFCYSLVRYVLQEEFDIDIPKHTTLAKEAIRSPNHINIIDWSEGWKVLPHWYGIQPGDVLRMRGSVELDDGTSIMTNQHIGVCVEPKRILHTELATGSIMEKVTSERFQWRPLQGYRFNG